MITEAVRDGKGIDGYPLGECLIYHWSPTSRRESILARGLRIRSVSAHSPVRYPFVCFSPSPLWAWDMSAGTFETAHGFEVIPWDDGTPREVRTYRSVPARVVRYVATRLA